MIVGIKHGEGHESENKAERRRGEQTLDKGREITFQVPLYVG